MKRHSLCIAFCGAMLLSVMLSGCKKDRLYLNDTDLTTEVDMGLALPVGTMRATIGDFLGGDRVEGLYIDSMNNRGVFTYKGNYQKQLYYHNVDLSQYISSSSLTMNVYDELRNMAFVHDHKVTGTGKPFTLSFPMAMKLNGINRDEYYERLDSALIKNANFTSTIQKSSSLPLKWEWIVRLRNTREMYGFRFADASLRALDYDWEIDVVLWLDTLTTDSPESNYTLQKTLFERIAEDYPELQRNKKKLTEAIYKSPYFNALQVRFAYAVTCHKAQGGQWKRVFIDTGNIPPEQRDTDYLRWLYTAVTRATECVYLLKNQ